MTDTGSIFPKGQRAPTANFTGIVWVQPLIQSDSAFNVPVGYVTFEPGARSYWHSHAGGQALLAMGGIGYYQEQGKAIQILKKGDAVKCPQTYLIGTALPQQSALCRSRSHLTPPLDE